MRVPGVRSGEKPLVGWVEIARFLEVSVDTAQRWESPETLPRWATFPMPTHETMGHKWCLPSELDVWLAQQTVPGLVGGRLRSHAAGCGLDAMNERQRRLKKD